MEFADGSDLKFGASLSYYTIFSLPPLLIIIISLCGVFFGAEAVKGEIYGQISHLVGKDTAIQIQEMIKNVALSHDTVFATTIGVIMLLFGASGVFTEIQDSINRIWGIKAKPNRGFAKFIRNRLISFSMVVVIGFLMLVSLVLNAVVELLNNKLQDIFPHLSVYLLYAVNLVLLFGIITLLFAIVFKTLPDGKVSWKDALIGSTFTALLFMLGKSVIGLYLGNSSIATTYGAAGSLIVILLWVYYSALILYFGAEFTKVYAFTFGNKIIPNDYAVYVEKLEVEKEQLSKSAEPKAKVV
ncbi:MAG: YihY/virulence factor BrkB family protein [Bacteroidota bacterium]